MDGERLRQLPSARAARPDRDLFAERLGLLDEAS
jgi:hypothetical protein